MLLLVAISAKTIHLVHVTAGWTNRVYYNDCSPFEGRQVSSVEPIPTSPGYRLVFFGTFWRSQTQHTPLQMSPPNKQEASEASGCIFTRHVVRMNGQLTSCADFAREQRKVHITNKGTLTKKRCTLQTQVRDMNVDGRNLIEDLTPM